MNPLSPFAYHRRHKRQALLLLGLVALATLDVCVMVRLLESTGEQGEVNERYLTRFSEVAATGPSLEPSVVSQIRAHPDVARAIPEKRLYIDTPLNTSGGFRVVGVAWLIGALICGASLICMPLGLYAPRGLSLDFLTPTPWLFTLPIPVAVVAVSAGLVVWMLSRLDPVAVIERRP
jgi:hypothetical protein